MPSPDWHYNYDSPRLSWVILAFGFAVWTAIQGFLILMPLLTRAVPPEPKDILPYIARTARFLDCPQSDCPAVRDLRKQLSEECSNPDARVEHEFAATSLGSNRAGFSVLLIALSHAGLDLMQAYRIVNLAGPLLFAFGFAYLLCAAWGRTAAGITLLLTAFKVFPDTGLDCIVPSTLCMGIALFLWARVLSRNGAAPWAFVIATPLLVSTHLIGIAYVLMAASMALRLRGYPMRTILFLGLAVFVPLALFATFFTGFASDLSHHFQVFDIRVLALQGANSLVRVLTDLTVLRDGLFGSLPIFGGLAVLGFAAIDPMHRDKLLRALGVCGLFLGISLFFPPRDPGDFFLRIWIPVIVIIFGSIGSAFQFAFRNALVFVRSDDGHVLPNLPRPGIIAVWWPAALAAVCFGYGIQVCSDGFEQVRHRAIYRKERLPLKVCSSQVEALNAEAKPEDTVLYTSMILMPYYFIHGTMKFGAVYYHPNLIGQQTVTELLNRPNLHYAVAYNPLKVPPHFDGPHERRWGIAGPAFRYVPGPDAARRFGPVLIEDAIPMAEYKWLEIEPSAGPPPKKLFVLIRNEERRRMIRCIPIFEDGEPRYDMQLEQELPAGMNRIDGQQAEGRLTIEKQALHLGDSLSAVIEFDLSKFHGAKSFRIAVSGWRPQARITGIRFDSSHLNWPWEQKATLTVMHRLWEAGEMNFSFDPSLLLPVSLRKDSVKVMNDCGSSVLMRLDRADASRHDET